MSRPSSSRRERLTTFVTPRPKGWLIDLLGPVNRWLCLKGLPGLRDVPGLRALPGVRGLCDVRRIELEPADAQRLASLVQARDAVFIAPNHPEFFTDWMLDKVVSERCAPRMASWATHEIVNGTGAWLQRFWLANNLVAQIPGAGGAAGKAYSNDAALAGDAVLLHPEGQVGWHAHHVGPLFGGVAEMALDAAGRRAALDTSGVSAGAPRQRVWIAPVVWKLTFVRDVDRALHAEVDRVERTLGLAPSRGRLPDVASRVAAAYATLLLRDAVREGLDPRVGHVAGDAVRIEAAPTVTDDTARTEAAASAGADATRDGDTPATAALHLDETARLTGAAFEARRIALLDHLARRLVGLGAVDRAERDGETGLEIHARTARAAERWLRGEAAAAVPPAVRADVRRALATLRAQQRFSPVLYRGDTVTQEQVAENLKRLRSDHCRASWRDVLHRFVPRPVGPRVAHLRVPDPIEVDAPPPDTFAREAMRDALLAELRTRMQRAVDALHAQAATPRTYPNPWR